jgi:hypothetical protein
MLREERARYRPDTRAQAEVSELGRARGRVACNTPRSDEESQERLRRRENLRRVV